MGCLTIFALIGLLFFGVRLAPAEPIAIAMTVAPVEVREMKPTPTPSAMLITATFGADGANPMDLLTAAGTIQTRIDLLGLEDTHVIVSENADNPRLIIQTPPTDDSDHVFDLLTAPGYLEFVDLSPAANAEALMGERIWTTGQQERAGGGPPPLGARLQPGTLAPFETVIDGFLVLAAEAEFSDNYGGSWRVNVHFDGSAALLLQEFTAEHIGDALGIVVDGKVISAPTISAEIPGGTATVEGNFTETETRELAVQIGSGPLRIELELLELF